MKKTKEVIRILEIGVASSLSENFKITRIHSQFNIELAHWEDEKTRNSKFAHQMGKEAEKKKQVKIKNKDTNQMVIRRK